MALTDMVIMPGADYQDACDAIREKDGSTAVIKSGEMGAKIRAIETGGSASDPPNLFQLVVSDDLEGLDVWAPGTYREFAADTFPGLSLVADTINSSVISFSGTLWLRNINTGAFKYGSFVQGSMIFLYEQGTGFVGVSAVSDYFDALMFNFKSAVNAGQLTPDHLRFRNKTTEWEVYFMDAIAYLPNGYTPSA